MSTPIRPLSGTDFPAPAALPDERAERLLPEADERLLPEAGDRSRLEGAAETVGATLGRAVSTVRDLPRRFTVIKGGASDKASDAMEQASAKLDDIKVQAQHRAEELGSQVRDRAQAFGGQVRYRVQRARGQAQHYIHEYPLQCLGAVFGVAFLTGITLRIWRTRD